MISDLKELEKFLKICRKQGVNEITFQGIEIKFGDLPQKISSSAESDEEISQDSLSPEELAFYAVDQGIV